jgi:hypothetical protein
MGHQGRFALASLSAGYEFRKKTIAGTHGNERDAPTAAIRSTEIEPAGSTPERPLDAYRNQLTDDVPNRLVEFRCDAPR